VNAPARLGRGLDCAGQNIVCALDKVFFLKVFFEFFFFFFG